VELYLQDPIHFVVWFLGPGKIFFPYIQKEDFRLKWEKLRRFLRGM
jgi:hypothetical protein